MSLNMVIFLVYEAPHLAALGLEEAGELGEVDLRDAAVDFLAITLGAAFLVEERFEVAFLDVFLAILKFDKLLLLLKSFEHLVFSCESGFVWIRNSCIKLYY